ncbi:MAG: hypothetical protein HY826_13415 [Actinobacteria bacterium]|nr:hypothetical protein [Actinomycetota bacterium]
MAEHDLFEKLVAASPVRWLEESRLGDEQLLASLIETSPATSPRVRAHRRHGWVIAGASVTVILLAAFALLRRDAPPKPAHISCYSEAAVDPTHQMELAASDDPLAACRELWVAGAFDNRDVPRLTSCVTNDGIIAVVPGGEQTCAELGWSRWVGTFSEDERNLIAFRAAMQSTFVATCYSQSTAERAVRTLLSEYGLDDWQIATNDDWTNALPCTAGGVDPESKSVTLGARPRTDKDVDPKG